VILDFTTPASLSQSPSVEIILICRSGYRSGDAGKCLLKFGFTNVAHVVSGVAPHQLPLTLNYQY
jgi:rhodanese-related sulfurtransferase